MSDVSNSAPRGKRTLVEEGTEFEGTLSSRCPIDVMGKVKGDVSGPSIHISASGVLDGTVKVSELRSEGELAGLVDADKVQLSGRVRDKTVIRASALEVKLEREDGKMEIVFGECQLEVGAQPDKEAAIAAALGRDRTTASAPVLSVAAPAPSPPAPSAPTPTPTPASTPTPPAAAASAIAPTTAPRSDEATVETKGLPPDEAWNLPPPSNAAAAPSESPAGDAEGDRSGPGPGQGRRDRRRRGTLPPPPQ
jgi:cytoskeletal protein CcmA (bactofilin family)